MADGAGPDRPASTAAGSAAATRRRFPLLPELGRSRWRSEGWLLLELFALCGFVVVQPVLDIIGGSPDFFIFHGLTTGQIVALVALLVLVPPVLVWLPGALFGLAGRRPRAVAHLVTVAVLVLLFMIQLGKQLSGWRGGWLVVVAVLAAAVVLLGYLLLAPTRQLLRFAAIGPLVFVLLFTFVSPASAVVLAGDRPSTGGEPVETGPHPPIVMIVLDELSLVSLLDRAGTIDEQRYPNLARLAGDSTWYRNATTNAGWTPYALPSMLRGRWPADHAAPHHAVYPDNLFTLLGEVYDITASESISQLCPEWYCGGMDRSRGGLPVALDESVDLFGELVSPREPDHDTYDDFAEPTVAERLNEMAAAREERPEFKFREALAASQPVRFHDFMTELPASPADRSPTAGGAGAAGGPSGDPAADDRPPLHFLHLLMPHTPWTYLPDGMRYHHVRLDVDGEWWGRLAYQRYQAQLAYTDGLIGQTLDRLEASGLYDDALVVVTSDHGVSLTPGGAGSRELTPRDPGIVELAWVPLFIKEPGQTEGRVDDRNWQHVDLLPTLADHAGVEVPWEVDGISWLRERRTSPDKTFFSTLDRRGVLDGPAGFERMLADPAGFPPVPPPPLPELVGTAVAEHPTAPGSGRLSLAEPGWFESVDPASGAVPALVHGTVSGQVPDGTPVAIAVNGRIGAVVPVTEDDEGQRMFAGLVTDTSLFVEGENEVELFLVPDGTTLRPA